MATTFNPLTGQIVTTPDPVPIGQPTASQARQILGTAPPVKPAPTPPPNTATIAGASGVQQALATATTTATSTGVGTDRGIDTLYGPGGTFGTNTADGVKSITPVVPVGDNQVTGDIPAGISAETQDAFANLRLIFESYGLGDLAGNIEKLMKSGETPQGALVKLKYSSEPIDPSNPQGPKWNDAYTARFAGNAARIKNGLNALSEAQYISNENAYAETLKSYGLNNLLSTDRKVNEAKFATYIGNDMSSTEFNDRIKVASDNVFNADPEVMATFEKYYGGLSKNDLVSYFLAPDETLPLLKQKIAATQIGTAASQQNAGLGINEARAMTLADRMGGYGQLGNVAGMYQNVADVLPAGQKLSSIYQQAGINYDQTTAEDEYLLQNADAQKKRKQLASLERAQFQTDSGVNAQQGYGLGKSIQGKF